MSGELWLPFPYWTFLHTYLSHVSFQVLLPLLQSDLYEVMLDTLNGKLSSNAPLWQQDSSAVTVVMASAGYPGSYKKGVEIKGTADPSFSGLLFQLDDFNSFLFKYLSFCPPVSTFPSLLPQACPWSRTWVCRFFTPALPLKKEAWSLAAVGSSQSRRSRRLWRRPCRQPIRE